MFPLLLLESVQPQMLERLRDGMMSRPTASSLDEARADQMTCLVA